MDHPQRNAFLVAAALTASLAAALVFRMPPRPAPQPEPAAAAPASPLPPPAPVTVAPDVQAAQDAAAKIAAAALKGAFGGLQLQPTREYDRGVNELRSRLLTEADAVRRGGRWEFVEITDLVLEPRRYLGRRVAAFGLLNFLDMASAHPRFNLGDNYGGTAGMMPVSVASFDMAQKRGLMGLESMHEPAILEVLAEMRGTPQEEYYLEAVEVRSLGRLPSGVITPVSELLRKPFASPAPGAWNADRASPLRAAATELRREWGRRFVEIQDLILDPGSQLDRNVSTIGIVQHAEATAQDSFFSLVPVFATANVFQVRMNGLPLESRKALLRLTFPPKALAVRGKVRRAPNGAYYLEAAGVSFIGEAPPSVPQALSSGN